MYRSSLALCMLLALAFLAPSRAQIAPPNQMGVSMGHLHSFAKDTEAEKNFWVAPKGDPPGFGRGRRRAPDSALSKDRLNRSRALRRSRPSPPTRRHRTTVRHTGLPGPP